MSLTKEKRSSLVDDDFAVPEKRLLPITDEIHVRMAHSVLDNTKGLTDEQRAFARERIITRAHSLGIDTSQWKITPEASRLRFQALAMNIPDQLPDHPNQTKFTGVLTKVDEPSDSPLSGSGGKRIMIPQGVAMDALPSLLGMAIDFTHDLKGHDVKQKIGIITEATIVENEIQIAGFFYGADFPDEVKRIQTEKSKLGFSYEAQTEIVSMNDDPLVVKNCVFTGAAVLYKDYAAYTTTSITANKSSENRNMEKEKDKSNEGAITDTIALALEKITSRIEKIEASIDAREKAGKVEAASLQSMVKPHADALRTIASNLATAGIGMQAEVGHVAVLHKMADQMEAEAVLGRIPSTYGFYASKEYSNQDKKAVDQSSAEFKEIKASLADLTTLVNDVQKQAFHAAKEPERKTISPAIAHLLAKAGIKPSEEKKLTVEEVDTLLANKNIPVASRIAAKLELKQAGKME